MKKTLLTLALLLAALAASAQTGLTRSYSRRPLSEVLADIDKSTDELSISFIYNKLEDYPVTCQLSGEAPYDAILKVIGFYPVKVTRHESIVLIEPVYDTERKLSGRVLDETGQPLEFVNVALYSLADDKLITSGVTTANGDFVIPCDAQTVRLRAFLIGYNTVERECAVEAIGAILMEPSMQYKLDEVVITADAATTSAEKTSYFPSRTERNAAVDATSLLQHMMIPQLRVNPASGYITTLAGEGVSIFIDHMPATREDLEGMNTQDVKRVEIYDFPSDVRFQNKPHVVNFVMQKYEYGGYTKLTSTEAVLADFSANNSVYSKLSHKNWTFDANITSNFASQNHLGTESTETYSLPEQTVTRTELSENGTKRNIKSAASFRATYTGKKMQLSNRIEFLDDNTPKQELMGSVAYDLTGTDAISSISRQNKRELTPTYSGDWNVFLPKEWSLAVSPSFQFMRNKQYRFYQETTTIENNIDESASRLEWKIGLNKKLGKKHTIGFVNWGLNYHSDLDYTGSTTSTSKVNQFCSAAGLSYQLSTQNISIKAEYLYTFNQDKVNGQEISNPYSIANIFAQFSPSNHHAISAEIGYNSGTPSGAQRNPNIMQENELMYYCGNPDLDNFNMLKAQLKYTWLPSNTFAASAFVRHYYYHNNYANIYEPFNDGTAIIRRIENTGDVNETYVGASFSLRLLDGNLQFAATPRLVHFSTTGIYKENSNQFDLDFSAIYYLKQFNFVAGYSSPQNFYWRNSATWIHYRSDYYFSAGWGNAKWKAKIDLVNIGRTDWRNLTTIIQTPLYTQNAQAFNAGAHQRINLTLTYTFGYGKKVKQGNELGTATAGQSSIL